MLKSVTVNEYDEKSNYIRTLLIIGELTDIEEYYEEQWGYYGSTYDVLKCRDAEASEIYELRQCNDLVLAVPLVPRWDR